MTLEVAQIVFERRQSIGVAARLSADANSGMFYSREHAVKSAAPAAAAAGHSNDNSNARSLACSSVGTKNHALRETPLSVPLMWRENRCGSASHTIRGRSATTPSIPIYASARGKQQFLPPDVTAAAAGGGTVKRATLYDASSARESDSFNVVCQSHDDKTRTSVTHRRVRQTHAIAPNKYYSILMLIQPLHTHINTVVLVFLLAVVNRAKREHPRCVCKKAFPCVASLNTFAQREREKAGRKRWRERKNRFYLPESAYKS